jgi:DNA-binding transcriptional regulator YhcF (GntR family)
LDDKSTPIQSEEDNVLTLTEEDVYNIVKKIYDYDFKLLNKSDYNLELEREKIKVLNYSKNLLSFDMENNKMEIITDEEVNDFYELLKKRKNIYHFLIFLNNYRATGKYKLPERVYNIITKILNIIEDDLMKNMEFTLENLCLILSQTFYILKEGKKIYLIEGVKEHPIFKKKEFWQNQLNQMIETDIHKIELFSKKDEIKFSKEKKQQKINELILTKVVPLSKNMSEFGVSKENILKIIEPIITKYNVDQS